MGENKALKNWKISTEALPGSVSLTVFLAAFWDDEMVILARRWRSDRAWLIDRWGAWLDKDGALPLMRKTPDVVAAPAGWRHHP